MRRATPFFSRTEVKDGIDDLSERDNLLIYGGAGLTVDRTGQTWSSLVTELLTHQYGSGNVSEDERKRWHDAARLFVKELGPLQGASAAIELIKSQRFRPSDDEDGSSRDPSRQGNERELAANIAVSDILVPQLYLDNSWRCGQLTRGIATLALQFARQGRKAVIATTNYDSHALTDLRTEAKASEHGGGSHIEVESRSIQNPSVSSAVASEIIDVSDPTVVECVQLHGLVRRQAEPDGFPVLAESHYAASQQKTEEFLKSCFKTFNVLIVGSSFTDQPLLAALLDTRDLAKARRLVRYAVLTGAGIGADELDEETFEQISDLTRLRLQHFEAKPIFADYHAHVSQLVNEVSLATNARAGRRYSESSRRYGSRLDAWWREWSDTTLEDFRAWQSNDHDLLVHELDQLSADIGLREETLKLEVWLRWEPARRSLNLWCSSFAQFGTHRALKRADIEFNSSYASVRAFCEGRPMYYASKDFGRPVGRWQFYLAAPLVLPGEVDLPVGVVVIASTGDERGRSVISERQQGMHKRPLEGLKKVGRLIASTDARVRRSQVPAQEGDDESSSSR